MKFTLCWVLDDYDDVDAGEEEARGSGRVPIDGKLRRPCVQRNESTRWHFHKAPLTTGLPVISVMEKNCPFFFFLHRLQFDNHSEVVWNLSCSIEELCNWETWPLLGVR
jgi:hypothetical protein